MNENNKKKRIMKEIMNIVYITLGCLVMAIAINLLLLPNKISTGGATGVATITYYIFKIPVSFMILIINIPLFLVALKTIGFKFCSKALLGTGLLSLFIQLTESLINVSWLNLSGDLFIGSIFGGILLGIGNSLVFKGEGSTGGSDLLAQIIYKKRSTASLSGLILIIDTIVIISIIIAFKDLNYGLYSVVALYLSKKTIEILFEGLNYSKVITVITKKGHKMAEEIMKRTDRGVTLNPSVIGKYTDEIYDELICVVTMQEVPKLKRIIKEMDSKAFTYISSANEVLGIGFKDS